ncbi:DUF5071 domain-containing protein [Paenibacillus sp. NPDC058071]|uniref:DUF5071 domain-containing protein n=1 Tax=Paenibacillus sp. NPDC058071 TaxID=3346326 RepID=UPI0036DB63B0
MLNINRFLPTHKSDYQSVNILKTLDIKEIEGISFELLKWVQDINWPIAEPICQLLIPLDMKIISEIKIILQSGDLEWVDNCLFHIVRFLSEDAILELKDELLRIANSPTAGEIEIELNLLSKKILKKIT